jgi:hypothetical protein
MHPTISMVDLDDGPAVQTSLCDAYNGEAIPAQLESFIETGTICPKYGQSFCPRREFVFLVPTPDDPGLAF